MQYTGSIPSARQVPSTASTSAISAVTMSVGTTTDGSAPDATLRTASMTLCKRVAEGGGAVCAYQTESEGRCWCY